MMDSFKEEKRALDEISRKVSLKRWFQSFELVPGIVTPGLYPYDAKAVLDSVGLKDLSGKQVLEIGTFDGALAFELEARGASVIALDIQDPDRTGFNLAREILNSKVTYVQCSVYELTSVLKDKFDSVFFYGVFYHLKHPILALEEIRKIIKKDGRLYFGGECLRIYAENLNGTPCKDLEIKSLAETDVPVALCYPGTYKRGEVWFVPNFACLKSWMRAAGLEIVEQSFLEDPKAKDLKGNLSPAQRMSGVAVVSEHGIAEEHCLW